MRRAALIAALALVCTPASAGADGADEALPGASVDSLLALARSRNPELAAQGYEAQAASERVLPAGALPDPTLRAEWQDITNRGSGASPNLLPGRVGATKYTVIQPLPVWGRRDLQREAAGAEADQAQGSALAVWADLAARVKSTYADYYRVSRALAVTREIIDLATAMERSARARYASGLTPQQDALRAQMELTTLRGELLELETEQHHLHARLNTLLYRPVAAPLAEPTQLRAMPSPAQLDYVALEQRLQANNPQLFIEQARIAAAEKNQALTEKNRYPNFSLGIAPTQTGSRIAEWEVMLEMNIPLRQESRRAQERESAARLEAARARRLAAQSQLLAALAENLAALEAAQRLDDIAAHSLLPQAEASLKAALAGYENGRLDFATLLDAQRQIRKARLDSLRAQANAQARLAEIERLLGEDL